MAFFPHQTLVRTLEACVGDGVDVGESHTTVKDNCALLPSSYNCPGDRIFPVFPTTQNFSKEEGAQACGSAVGRSGQEHVFEVQSQADFLQVENW